LRELIGKNPLQVSGSFCYSVWYENDQKNTSEQEGIQALKEDILVLKQQLDWFKRHLFGRKSEKQLLDELDTQGSLFATDKSVVSIDTSTEIKAHKRKFNKQLNGDEVNGTGLRFDASVPMRDALYLEQL
jgi:transposase